MSEQTPPSESSDNKPNAPIIRVSLFQRLRWQLQYFSAYFRALLWSTTTRKAITLYGLSFITGTVCHKIATPGSVMETVCQTVHGVVEQILNAVFPKEG